MLNRPAIPVEFYRCRGRSTDLDVVLVVALILALLM